jgi:magnesium transporter
MGMVVGCAAYEGGRRAAELGIDELFGALAHESWFVWVDLHEPDEALLRRIQDVFRLHDLAIEDAHGAHERPKLEEYDDSLFVVLRTVHQDAARGALDFGETHVFVGRRYVVTVRHGTSVGYDGVRAHCESAPHLLAKGPGFVLYAVMDFVVDSYFPAADALEDLLEQLERDIFAGSPPRDTAARIYALKGDVIGLKRAVLPLIEVCNRLVRFDLDLIEEDARLYFRDVYDHVIRINEQIDNVRELLTSALEAHLSLVAVQQNEIMKKLAGWAAILGVPTMIAGIYGMNFHNMPELEWPWGYPAVWAVMLTASGGLYLYLKRRGWL